MLITMRDQITDQTVRQCLFVVHGLRCCNRDWLFSKSDTCREREGYVNLAEASVWQEMKR